MVLKARNGKKELHFRWGVNPELKLQFKTWWSLDLGGLVAVPPGTITWQCKGSCQVRGQQQSTGTDPA